jgi:hypothetical protein
VLKNLVLLKKNLVGIFDLEQTSTSKITREYLATLEKVQYDGENMRTFIVSTDKVYISDSTTNAIKRNLFY